MTGNRVKGELSTPRFAGTSLGEGPKTLQNGGFSEVPFEIMGETKRGGAALTARPRLTGGSPMSSTQRTVTLYRHNRLDEAYEADPAVLAAQFVSAIQSPGYEAARRPSVEFEYRWWLSGPEANGGGNSTWDEADSDALLNGLRDYLDANSAAKDVVMAIVYGEDA